MTLSIFNERVHQKTAAGSLDGLYSVQGSLQQHTIPICRFGDRPTGSVNQWTKKGQAKEAGYPT
jgi:hypothetical protein